MIYLIIFNIGMTLLVIFGLMIIGRVLDWSPYDRDAAPLLGVIWPVGFIFLIYHGLTYIMVGGADKLAEKIRGNRNWRS